MRPQIGDDIGEDCLVLHPCSWPRAISQGVVPLSQAAPRGKVIEQIFKELRLWSLGLFKNHFFALIEDRVAGIIMSLCNNLSAHRRT